MTRQVDLDARPIQLPLPSATARGAFSRFWRKGFAFSGRASRSEFWKARLINVVILVGLYLLVILAESTMTSAGSATASVALILFGLYFVAYLIPDLASVFRRLHDGNNSGAMFLLAFIPLVGPIIVFVLLVQASNPAGARFDAVGAHGGAVQGGVTPRAGGDGNPALLAPPPPPTPPAPLPVKLTSDPLPHGFGSAPPPPPPPATPTFSSSAVPAATAPPFPPQTAPVGGLSAAPPPPPQGVGGSAPIAGIPGFSSPSALAQPAVPVQPAAFASTPPPPPPATQEPVQAEPAYDLDETRVAPAARLAASRTWALRLPDGSSIPLEGVVYLGRNPAAAAEHPGARIVPIVDTAGSMSKTHARISAAAEGVEVTDLHSTNGTRVTAPGGVPERLVPGVPRSLTGAASVSLGDVVVEVSPLA